MLLQPPFEFSTAPNSQRSGLASVASYIDTVGFGMPLGSAPVVPM